MKKIKEIVGKRMKNDYDPKLAKPQSKGSSVSLVQSAIDNVWGRYYFPHYFRCGILFEEVETNYKDTMDLLNKCRQLEVRDDNSRLLPEELRNQLEIASTKFTVLLKIAFEYLTIELLGSINNIVSNENKNPITVPWQNLSLEDRIHSLKRALGYNAALPSVLNTLFQRRDIIEHPSSQRIYNNGPHTWKTVHLSWVLSGEIEGMWSDINSFVEGIGKNYEHFTESHKGKGNIKLNVKRGLKSNDPFKRNNINAGLTNDTK